MSNRLRIYPDEPRIVLLDDKPVGNIQARGRTFTFIHADGRIGVECDTPDDAASPAQPTNPDEVRDELARILELFAADHDGPRDLDGAIDAILSAIGDPRATCPLSEYECGDSRCNAHHRECNQDGSQCWHDRNSQPVPAGNERATCCDTGRKKIMRHDGAWSLRVLDGDPAEIPLSTWWALPIVACPFCGASLSTQPVRAHAFNLGGTMDRRPFVEIPPTFQGIAAHLDDPVMVRALLAALCNERDQRRNEVSAGNGDVGEVLDWYESHISPAIPREAVAKMRATVEQLAGQRDGYRVALDDARDGLDPVLLCAWADGEKECAASACTGTALCPRHVGSAIERLRADLARRDAPVSNPPWFAKALGEAITRDRAASMKVGDTFRIAALRDGGMEFAIERVEAPAPTPEEP